MTTHDIAKVERTEMYLKSVLVIAAAGHRVTTSRVAEAMGVSAPSASEMLKRLEHQGYVEASPDGPRLTRTGRLIATQVVRRLRLAERLLTDILKMDLAAVYDEACKMEHVISPEVEARLDDVLDHPVRCPHGHPIPTPDGAFPPGGLGLRREPGRPPLVGEDRPPGRLGTPYGDRTLAGLPARRAARITALPEEHTPLLKAALRAGLRLGERVSVEAAATPRGPLIIRLNGVRATLPREVAEQIWVSTDEEA